MPRMNPDLKARIERALADSAAGRTVDLGDFTQYAVGFSDIEWTAEHLTAHEAPQAGWYVLGRTPGTPRTTADYLVQITEAFTPDGDVVDDVLARLIAALLNGERR